MLKSLDVFSGIGGFALASQWLGIETVGFCEIDEFCQRVLSKNFPGIPIYPDIKLLDLETLRWQEIDLICGGFPCQDLSLCNTKGEGLRGKKSGLLFEMFRIISEVKPLFGIFENVPPSRNRSWDTEARAIMAQMGYRTQNLALSAQELGAPHVRKRLFLVSYADGLGISDIAAQEIILDCLLESKKKFSADWARLSEPRRSNSGRVFYLPHTFVPVVDDGLPGRLDGHRLNCVKAYGNSVVPQCAYVPLLVVKRLWEMI